MDGNGRVGRFLMNTTMASGGYPWTVIPVDDRNAYVNALEKASVGEDIAPFADLLAGLVKKRLAGEPLPAVPKSTHVDERSGFLRLKSLGRLGIHNYTDFGDSEMVNSGTASGTTPAAKI